MFVSSQFFLFLPPSVCRKQSICSCQTSKVTRKSTPGRKKGTNSMQSLPSAVQSTGQPGRPQQRWKHGMAHKQQPDATAPRKPPVITSSTPANPCRAPPQRVSPYKNCQVREQQHADVCLHSCSIGSIKRPTSFTGEKLHSLEFLKKTPFSLSIGSMCAKNQEGTE